MTALLALLSGILFGVGLIVSNMANPEKVLAFLNLRGTWDPSLLLVMLAAVVTSFLGIHLANRLGKPVCEECFTEPAVTGITWQLVSGSILFGIGWGLVGYCPGPALVNLVLGNLESFYFCTAMALGSVSTFLINKIMEK